ncbi:MAG TPA: hypothetical protein VK540_34100 [Polyangiaceae bacterium]|nr:hypothetical protein [Polyangiaceae bacterium]
MREMEKTERKARKLLVASLGVATLSYVSAGQGCAPVANLVAGPGGLSDADTNGHPNARPDVPIANLVPPPFDVRRDFPVANLVAPPIDVRSEVIDTPSDVSTEDAADAPTDAADDNPPDVPPNRP